MSPASAWLAVAIIAMMTCARGVRAATSAQRAASAKSPSVIRAIALVARMA